MRVVINADWGGFGLSDAALTEYKKRTDQTNVFLSDIPRTCPHLIAILEEMGAAANSDRSALKIIDIPDGIEWQLESRDGLEWIAEAHRTWS